MQSSCPSAFARRLACLGLLLACLLVGEARCETWSDAFRAGYRISQPCAPWDRDRDEKGKGRRDKHRPLSCENWGEALVLFDRAIRSKAEPGGQVKLYGRNYVPYLPYYWRGVALFELGVFDNATRDWTDAQRLWAELFPRNQAAFDEYRRDIERRKAEFLAKTQGDAERYLSLIAVEMGEWQAALDDLPGDDPTKVHLARDLERATAESARLRQKLESAEVRASPAELAALRRALDRLLTGLQNRRRRPEAGSGEIHARALGTPRASEDRLRAMVRKAVYERASSSAVVAQPAQRRGPAPSGPTLEEVDQDADRELVESTYAGKHALLVGFRDYEHWGDLDRVPERLADLSRVLREVGFSVEIVNQETVGRCGKGADGTRQQVKKCLQGFVDKYGKIGPRSLLLVHIVGHGHTACVDGARLGLVLLPDAPLPPDDLPMRCDPGAPPETWEYVGSMEGEALFSHFFRQFEGKSPHHILITLESCFSGQFILELGGRNYLEWRLARNNPAFLFLTSGTANQITSADLPLTSALTRALDACRGRGRHLLGFDLADYLTASLRAAELPSSVQVGKRKKDPFDKGDVVLSCRD